MRNRRKMQHTVRRTPKRHIHRKRIAKCRFCHNIPRPDIFAVHLHHCHPRVLRQLNPLRIHCRNRPVAPKPHAKNLGQTIHTVCRIHSRTRSAGRAGMILKILHILLGHRPCRISAHCLKHARKAGFFSFHMPCKHGAAADKHCRYIHPRRCHQKPRNILVAVGNHHQRVKLVRQSHTLRRIGN